MSSFLGRPLENLFLYLYIYELLLFCQLVVFPNVPETPGLPCLGEDRNMYRRGAKKWRKFYRVNGHLFQAKRFSRVSISPSHAYLENEQLATRLCLYRH